MGRINATSIGWQRNCAIRTTGRETKKEPLGNSSSRTNLQYMTRFDYHLRPSELDMDPITGRKTSSSSFNGSAVNSIEIYSAEKAAVATPQPSPSMVPEGGKSAATYDLEHHKPPVTPAVDFPDGGILAWVQVLAGFFLMFSSWGLVTSFGVFQTYYIQPPALATQSKISGIGSVQTCLLLFCGAFSGRLMDAGYARLMSSVGSVMIFIGLFMASFSGHGTFENTDKTHLEYWQLLLSQGFCQGLGMGLTFLPSVGIPATYFVKRRALATGVVACGASIGGIIYPIVFNELLERVGFRWACRAVALLALVTLAVACAMMKQRTDLPSKAKGPLLEFRAMREPTYFALVMGMVLSFCGVYIPYYYIQSRATESNVDLHGMQSYYLVILLNAGGFFGRLLPGIIADKRGPLFIHATVVVVAGVLLFVWPFVLNLPGLVIFALLYGFFSGGFTSLPAASVAYATQDMSGFGARMGFAVTMNGFGALAGKFPNFERCFAICASACPPIAGAIIEAGEGYVGAAVFAGLTVILGGVLLVIAGSRCPGAWEKFSGGILTFTSRNSPE
ncbi:uncharacterized protein L3040_003037 [Drepanopeziza brunnea f. sp. 'multigermtubi']|uniref:uncharacterized protein n=1 Tax=Drepanopeziza brunnea f. sp. 'multigermtubi' TaxID=698441 RepID=UPI00238A9E2D|nr:hypothetical protein L3040_003037 [Drepanopeziza brunnea f. sp. 'multigermtubi']